MPRPRGTPDSSGGCATGACYCRINPAFRWWCQGVPVKIIEKWTGLLRARPIRMGQQELALGIITKPCPCDDVIGAGSVINPESRTAAVGGNQVCERISRALGLRYGFPAMCGLLLGMRHKHAVMAVVVDGNVTKLIIVAPTHENAQVICSQNGVADDVMIESQIK